MTEEKLSKDLLLKKFESIKQYISESDFWYYHIGAIDNFIFHIDNFKSERTSARMAHQIDQYLTLLNQKLQTPHDKHGLAKELYPHIWKIGDTYDNELGFKTKTPFWIIFGLWTIVFLLVNATGPTWIAIITAVVGAVLHSVLVYAKNKTKRTY